MVKEIETNTKRRQFIKGITAVGAGIAAAPLMGFSGNVELEPTSMEEIYLVGPKEGFTPHIGALLSTMTMMRQWVVDTVKNLTTEQLDFQIDDKSNSIGAMLMHLAATEKYYQLNTFEKLKWGSWDKKIKKEWDVASGLGERARKKIKGNEIGYYLAKLEEVRKVTIDEMAKRNDEWLMESEPFFAGQPTNNYCKWFHVCEHESNHRGQFKFIIKRIPKKEE